MFDVDISKVNLFLLKLFCRSLDGLWNSIKEQLATEALKISCVTSTFQQQALQPLQVFLLGDLEKRYRGVVQNGKKLIKDYCNAKVMLQKSIERYYRSANSIALFVRNSIFIQVC